MNNFKTFLAAAFVLFVTSCSTYKPTQLTSQSKKSQACLNEIDQAVKTILSDKGYGETPPKGYLNYLVKGSVEMNFPSLDYKGGTSYNFVLNDSKKPKITLVQRTKGASTFTNTMKNGIKSIELKNCNCTN